uniref:Integrase catalytic domain-containing protein n=1 Tax=Stegastes partitus TaxID=144197 RepID=A0A3B4ZQ16_9TELE
MKIGADIFELNGQSYLLLVDYLTKYPEVLNIPDKTAHTVIQKMKSVFARHGIPKEIVSDHVPFASYEMSTFAASWEIKLTFSSPGFPSSNGMAERAINTVYPHLVLLSLRNTPVSGLNMSPAQMLMGRVLRSTLPCSTAVLKWSAPQNITDKIRDMQSRQKRHFDQRAKLQPALTPGNTVNMQTRCGWEPAVVIRQREEPRSYNMQTPAGKMFRRNRRHLRKIHPSLFRDTSVDEDSDSEHSPVEPQQPPQNIPPPTNVDNTPIYHTCSGRAVRRPARYRDD